MALALWRTRRVVEKEGISLPVCLRPVLNRGVLWQLLRSHLRRGERDERHQSRASRAAFSRAKSSPAWCDERVNGEAETMRKPLA